MCESWAQIDTDVIQETTEDVAAYLTVRENGAIIGLVPMRSISSTLTTLEVVVTDPQGDVSSAGVSNTMNIHHNDLKPGRLG